jgi:methionyl-tRNA formyltransferase
MEIKKSTTNLILLADISCKHSSVYLESILQNDITIEGVLVINFNPKLSIAHKYKPSQLIKFITAKRYKNYLNKLRILYLCKINRLKHESIELDNFNDSKILKYLDQHNDCAFLYTCGGKVPEKILVKHKIIHIHLGWVPFYRGSDCLMYSIIYSNQITASIFYMSKDIDAGNIISQMRMPIFDFRKINPYIKYLSAKKQYRFLNNHIDPIIRSFFLIKMLKFNESKNMINLNNIEQRSQNKNEFFTIHPELYKYCLKIWRSKLSEKSLSFKQALERLVIFQK